MIEQSWGSIIVVFVHMFQAQLLPVGKASEDDKVNIAFADDRVVARPHYILISLTQAMYSYSSNAQLQSCSYVPYHAYIPSKLVRDKPTLHVPQSGVIAN